MKNRLPVATSHKKEYWLSRRDRDNTPEYQVLVRNEFVTEPPDARGIDRRSFLGIMGASMALAGLTSCRRPEDHIVPYVSRPEDITPGNSLHYATSMPLGTESEALLVETREGRPFKIMGNALASPIGNSASVWAHASILGLYDPDRSMHALRTGEASTVGAFADFWKIRREEFVKNAGEGLVLLTESFASPTLSRLLELFTTTFPKAMVVTHEAVSDRAILDGHALAFGTPLVADYDFGAVDVLLALDADVFGTERGAFEHARAFTRGRAVDEDAKRMNRFYLAESGLTQSAAMADHRLRVAASRIPAVLAALARELAANGVAVPGELLGKLPAPKDVDAAWISAVAKDLAAHRGRSLLVAGRGQHASVHAVVAALNHALGNTGATVRYVAPRHTRFADDAALPALMTALKESKVQMLLMLGGNPVFTMPADLEFRTALESAGSSVHCSLAVDETSSACTWHLPRRHYLESWGDVSFADGRLGVIQPLIAPLFDDGIADAQLLSLLCTGTLDKDGDIVRATWKALSDDAWRSLLHDGSRMEDIPPVAPAPNNAAVAAAVETKHFNQSAPSRGDMEVVFRLSPTVHDGRFANNAWLQEFPDPVTKLTWDNAALMSRATAEALGLKDGDLVRIKVGGRETPMPVWMMPGQAEYSITVLLGYGRRKAGRVGSGVGFNAYRIRGTKYPYVARGARVSPPFGTHALACVQDHHGLDTERMAREGVRERVPMLLREGTIEEYRKDPHFAEHIVHMPQLRSMWKEHEYGDNPQWGMSIDLNACIGCGACTIACQSENNIPVVGKEQVLNGREMHWIRIDRYYKGDEDEPGVRVMPVACHHCEMAPCEQVCPVAATTHDEEGLNVMTYNRCIGTRYCSNNCPYKVRRFNFLNYTGKLPEIMKSAQNPDVSVRFRGVMEKCTYCTQRIERGKIAAKLDGRALKDGDVQSACQQACPTQAISFGDILDRGSAVAKAKESPRNYALLGELNLRPRTTFLAKIRNPNPALEDKRPV